jgi:hypothetical protein
MGGQASGLGEFRRQALAAMLTNPLLELLSCSRTVVRRAWL